MRLVLATRNPHKVRELGALLDGYEVVALPDEVALPTETGTTFAANALPIAGNRLGPPRAISSGV